MSGKKTGSTELFRYNPATAREAAGICFLPTEELVNPARPLGLACDLLDTPSPDLSRFFTERPAQEALYYIVMLCRDVVPHFFPVHDICLLAANMLRPQLRHKPELVLLDWEMLPPAALAAGSGARIVLPPTAMEQEGDASRLAALLRRRMPEAAWLEAVEFAPLADGCLVLGQQPLRHGERDPRFLERLRTISGGVFYTAWDFLGVKLHAHTRSLWVKNGLIRSVLQLPRPRRQGAAVYPALLELGTTDTTRPIRLARIASCGVGPGALDQEFALALLGEKPLAKGESLTLTPDVLARDGLFDLSPAAHLSKQKAGSQAPGLTLRHRAQVLRCQLSREKVSEEECGALQSHAPDKDWLGECPDGSFLCREVGISELDPLTGFLDEHGGNIVRLELTLLGKQGKYVLQAGDILFAFRGSASSVGQVGFVEEEGEPAVTVQALCIIRCLPDTDPVWLYHYLRRASVREWIRARATGSTLLTVNLESIRDLPLEAPAQSEVEEVNAEHRNIAAAMGSIAELRREMRASLWRIQRLGNLAEEMQDAQRSAPKGHPTDPQDT